MQDPACPQSFQRTTGIDHHQVIAENSVKLPRQFLLFNFHQVLSHGTTTPSVKFQK